MNIDVFDIFHDSGEILAVSQWFPLTGTLSIPKESLSTMIIRDVEISSYGELQGEISEVKGVQDHGLDHIKIVQNASEHLDKSAAHTHKLTTSGKPSTWLPLGRLVEQTKLTPRQEQSKSADLMSVCLNSPSWKVYLPLIVSY